MNGNVNVTARFEAGSTSETRELTVKPAGTGSGTVSSSPAGILCGRQCANSFPKDKQVVLKAVAADGSRFTGWGGGCGGVQACQVVLSDDATVTANFEMTATPDLTLTVNPVGEGSGTVVSRRGGHLVRAAVLGDLPQGHRHPRRHPGQGLRLRRLGGSGLRRRGCAP